MTFLVTEGCLDLMDKACLTQCPVDCLYVGARMTYINPDECIDCGACEPLCPHDAIYYEPDLPAALATFVDINAEFFAETGPPGGSLDVDFTNRDHPLVAAMPVRPAED
jgi:NAD-dependent dihydropyrimidine dehydrogenase PreA subunit